MPDITSYLQGLSVPQQAKADAWEAYQAPNKNTFVTNIGKLVLPQSAKADLYEMKFGGGAQTPPPTPAPAPSVWDRVTGAVGSVIPQSVKDDWNDLGGVSGILNDAITGSVHSKSADALVQGQLQKNAQAGDNFSQQQLANEQWAQKPLAHVTDRPDFQKVFDPNSQNIASRAITGVVKTAEGLTTPENLYLGAALPFSGPVGELGGLQFGAQAGVQGTASALDAAQSALRGKTGDAAEQGTQALLNAIMAGTTLGHGASGAPEAAPVEAPAPVEPPAPNTTPPNAAGARDVITQSGELPYNQPQLPNGTGNIPLGEKGQGGVLVRPVRGLLPASTEEAPAVTQEAPATPSTSGHKSPLSGTVTLNKNSFNVNFEDPTDAAAFQLATKKSQTAQAPLLEQLKAANPDIAEADLRDHATAVRQAVKDAARNASAGDTLSIPSMSNRLRGDLLPDATPLGALGDGTALSIEPSTADAGHVVVGDQRLSYSNREEQQAIISRVMSERGSVSDAEAAPADTTPAQTPEASALEDKMRPQIGRVMRLNQLLDGDENASILRRGISEANNMNGSGLTPEERKTASAVLGQDVGLAFTPEQVDAAREMLGHDLSEKPQIIKLQDSATPTADTQRRIAASREAMVEALNRSTDPDEQAVLNNALSPDENGNNKKVLYEPTYKDRPAISLAADHPEAPFAPRAFGADAPEINLKNVATALGKTPRDLSLGHETPEQEALNTYRGSANATNGSSEGNGTVGENLNGFSEVRTKKEADPTYRALKNARDRAAIKERIRQIARDLRTKAQAWSNLRDPAAKSALEDQLKALPKSSLRNLPKELKDIAKPPKADKVQTSEAPKPEEPVAKAAPVEKAPGTVAPTTRKAADTARLAVESIQKNFPQKLGLAKSLQQVALEHFGEDTDGAIHSLGRSLSIFKDGLKRGDDYALQKAIKAIRQMTPYGDVSERNAGVTPANVRKSAGAVGRFVNPNLTPADIQAISTDALTNILDRYERMSPLTRSAYSEQLWSPDLDRHAFESDPNAGLTQRLADVRGTVPQSRNFLARIGDLFNRFAPDLLRQDFRTMVRSIRGESTQHEVILKAALAKYSKEVATWKVGESLDFIHRMERGLDQGDPLKNELAFTLRSFLDDARVRLSGMRPDVLQSFIQDYFPHMWANVGRAREEFTTLANRTGLTGDESFLKAREHELFEHGLNAGLQPLSYDPIRIVSMRVMQMEKMIAKEKVVQGMGQHGWRTWIKGGDPVPQGLKPLEDRSFSTQGQVPGRYYAPDKIATDFNRLYGPGGLSGKSVLGLPLYDYLRHMNGVSAMLQLGFSGVHAATTARNSLGFEISRIGNALQNKRWVDAGKSALWSSTALGPVIRDVALGQTIGRAIRDPQAHLEYADFTHNWQVANGHIGPDELYGTHFADMLNRSWKIVGDQNFPVGRRIANAPKAAYAALGRTLEMASYPIMQKMVPNAKMAAFFHATTDLMKDHTGDANSFDRSVQQISDNMDDHFGELNSQNLWWNKTSKDISSLMLLARGWTLGNARMYLGSVADVIQNVRDLSEGKVPKLTQRQLFAGGSLAALMYTNAMYQNMHPGSPQVQGLDYFYPRDGTKDGNGEWNRTNPLAPEFDPISYAHDPFGTLMHKASPTLATAMEIHQNRDYYNHQIVDPSDGLLEAAGKRVDFALTRNTPLSVQNYQESKNRGEAGAGTFLANQFGYHPSPKWVGRTDAENLANQYFVNQEPQGPMDDATYERSQNLARIRSGLSTGEIKPSDLGQYMKDGTLSPGEARYLVRSHNQTGLQRWTAQLKEPSQVLNVWNVATPEERQELLPIMGKQIRKVDPQHRAAFVQALKVGMQTARNPAPAQ